MFNLTRTGITLGLVLAAGTAVMAQITEKSSKEGERERLRKEIRESVLMELEESRQEIAAEAMEEAMEAIGESMEELRVSLREMKVELRDLDLDVEPIMLESLESLKGLESLRELESLNGLESLKSLKSLESLKELEFEYRKSLRDRGDKDDERKKGLVKIKGY